MRARFTYRLISGDRSNEVFAMASMPVDAAVVLPHAKRTIVDLASRSSVGNDVDADVLHAAAERLASELIGSVDVRASSTALMANGWLLVARLDKRDVTGADEPYLPMALAA